MLLLISGGWHCSASSHVSRSRRRSKSTVWADCTAFRHFSPFPTKSAMDSQWSTITTLQQMHFDWFHRPFLCETLWNAAIVAMMTKSGQKFITCQLCVKRTSSPAIANLPNLLARRNLYHFSVLHRKETSLFAKTPNRIGTLPIFPTIAQCAVLCCH